MFESFKTKEQDNDEMINDNKTYLTANGKFDILNEYFGISALSIPYT